MGLCGSENPTRANFSFVGAAALTREVAESDFEGKGARFTNPQITAATMAWATEVLVV